jgi:hypothetical protein
MDSSGTAVRRSASETNGLQLAWTCSRGLRGFTSTEVVYGVADPDVTVWPVTNTLTCD